jgi:hypothetical protein
MAENGVVVAWAIEDGATSPFHHLAGYIVRVTLTRGKPLEHLEIAGTDADDRGETLVCKVLDDEHVEHVGDVDVPFRHIQEIHIY